MNKEEAWQWMWRHAPTEVVVAFERLERGEGSGALTGFVAAKRADETGRAEEEERSDDPQSLAVSPGEAEAAALVAGIGALFDKSHWAMEASMQPRNHGRYRGRKLRALARETMKHAGVLAKMLPEPDSEQSENAGDGKQSQESPEASADTNNGTASGRRNAEPSDR